MNTTKLLTFAFQKRLREIDRYATDTLMIQQNQLYRLIMAARNTEWGKKYDYNTIDTYDEFSKRVPLQTYEEVKPYVERMLRGEQNILWGSDIVWFAKSSGTTNDKSKFIPVSREALDECHYQGGKDAVAIYLRMNPESRFLSGKGLILGGSHKPDELAENIHYGDLSAVLIQNVSFMVDMIRVPSKEIALMDEWEAKLEAMANSTVKENVTNMSGVPSWFLVLIKKILQKENKKNLLEVWPNLEVFFHGGISFAPYREQYKELIPSDQMHYVETYNASEGFFGIQNDFNDASMLLMIDLGVFFEFIPLEEIDAPKPTVVPLWQVEPGRNYAVVISTNSGLWRYIIGDTVKFTSVNPYKFIITGRTKHYINAFGEELMVANADKGIEIACEKTGAVVTEYTAGPTFMSGNKKGHHTWLIEFSKAPASTEEFAEILDRELQNLNSDYEAKRYKGLFLDRLELIPARTGLFHDWLKNKGKLGGQHKIPRLSNSRTYLEELMGMNKV
ncbi:MAG: GH3 auxin-responsive promoter family protein [Bacteroidales bacterium]